MRTQSWTVHTMYFDVILLYFVIGMILYIAMVSFNKKTMIFITSTMLTVSVIFMTRKLIYGEPVIQRLSFDTFIFVTTFFWLLLNAKIYLEVGSQE
jgi:CDP-diglyceride synthetase